MAGRRFRAKPEFKQLREASPCCGRKVPVRTVAEKAGVSAALVSRAEDGKATVGEETAYLLAKAVGAAGIGVCFTPTDQAADQ